jgi:hypothetical protein
MITTIEQKLADIGACGEAREWAAQFPSAQKAWDSCERGDWMLWLCGKFSNQPESDGRKRLVLCACECARRALPFFEKRRAGDDRVRKCLDTAERWARGEVTADELRDAKRAAHAAADAARAASAVSYAAHAAYAASYAAHAAYAASYVAADAAYAPYAAYAVSYAAHAAYAASYVAADAAYAPYAAYAAADAAAAAAAVVARSSTLRECADIVRKHYPKVPNPEKI